MKRWLWAAALCLAACGGDAEERRSREPVPAPRVELSAADRERWTAAPATRAGVPVLLYSGVEADAFARQMALLDHAGYETIELDELVRLVGEQDVSLPPRPFVLTDELLRGIGYPRRD